MQKKRWSDPNEEPSLRWCPMSQAPHPSYPKLISPQFILFQNPPLLDTSTQVHYYPNPTTLISFSPTHHQQYDPAYELGRNGMEYPGDLLPGFPKLNFI